jgi:hypothetical protein
VIPIMRQELVKGLLLCWHSEFCGDTVRNVGERPTLPTIKK